MIAAQDTRLDYVAAATELGLTGSDAAKKKFIQRRVARGEIKVLRASWNRPRISKIALLKYIAENETLKRRSTTKRTK